MKHWREQEEKMGLKSRWEDWLSIGEGIVLLQEGEVRMGTDTVKFMTLVYTADIIHLLIFSTCGIGLGDK
jgi:hypothetical protein